MAEETKKSKLSYEDADGSHQIEEVSEEES